MRKAHYYNARDNPQKIRVIPGRIPSRNEKKSPGETPNTVNWDIMKILIEVEKLKKDNPKDRTADRDEFEPVKMDLDNSSKVKIKAGPDLVDKNIEDNTKAVQPVFMTAIEVIYQMCCSNINISCLM